MDKPVLIVRDKAGEIRAFSNVCRHRSTILASGSGNRKLFTCPYHAWPYDLNGCLRAAPYMDKEQVKNISLPEYRVEIWQGLIFVSLHPEADPLALRLEKLEARMSAYNLAAHKVVHRTDLEIACNWKVLVENASESYHVFQVHQKTLAPDSTATIRVWEGGSGFNNHTMTFNTNKMDAGKVARLPTELRDLAQFFCVYPCLAVAIEAESAIWLSVRPTGPQTARYTQHIALFPDVTQELADAYRDFTFGFMNEDRRMLELVQRGLAADVGSAGVLHPWERTNWEFGHYLVRKMTRARAA